MKWIKYFETETKYEYNFYSIEWGDSPDKINEIRNYLSEKFTSWKPDEHDDYDLYLTLEKNNKIVAACEFSFYYEEEEEEDIKYPHLFSKNHSESENIEVKPNYISINYIYTDMKRRGIASKIIKMIIDQYPQIKIFGCYIRESNIASINMFKKLGFKFIKIDGNYKDGEKKFYFQYRS